MRASCWVSVLAPAQAPLDDVLGRGDDDARDADAEVAVEARVLGRDDRLAERRRDVVVLHDDAPLGRELADDLAVRGVDARDRVRRVVVERLDLGQVAGVGEQDAADDAEDRGEDEQRDEPGAPGDANDDVGHGEILSLIRSRQGPGLADGLKRGASVSS